MISIVTWFSVIFLGPGSLAIFCWFLFDLRHVVRRER
jgi:hypothetical protein